MSIMNNVEYTTAPEDCLAVLLERAAERLEKSRGARIGEEAVSFALKAWAAVQRFAGASRNPDNEVLACYADYAFSGMLTCSPGKGEQGLASLIHLGRQGAAFLLAGRSFTGARERVVRLYGLGVGSDRHLSFDNWLLAEVGRITERMEAL